jgi:tRNA(Ile)-lysidine synthase
MKAPGAPLQERVQNTISRYNMIPPGTRLGVAVSGGADSVFLLHALLGYRPCVIHINHGLRGADSDADEWFTAQLAARLGLPFYLRRIDQPPAGNLEQFCRRQRLGFFRLLRERSLVDRIATGHTASDQSETVLMRMLRGTGTTGLRGVRPLTNDGIVRPLLALHRDEIRRHLQHEGIAWREDATNESSAFLRNRVRSKLLPLLRDWQPAIDASLQRIAEISECEEEYWTRETAAALADCAVVSADGVIFDCRSLAHRHPALAIRVIRAAIGAVLGSLDRLAYSHLVRILDLARQTSGEGRVRFPGGIATRSLDWLRLEASRPPAEPVTIPLPVPGQIAMRGFTMYTWIEENVGVAKAYTHKESVALDWGRLRPPLMVRNWEPGERFHPEGESKARPLRDWFQRRRIPSWERRFWPIITDETGIVWVRSLGVACDKAVSEQTHVLLRLRLDTVSSK